MPEVQEAAHGGKKGEKDKVADAEGEPERVTEGREDQEQVVQRRGVRADKPFCRDRQRR